MKSLLKLIIAIAIIGGISWYFLRGKAEDAAPAGPPAVKVSTHKVSFSEIPVIINAVGNVTPEQSVALRSRIDSQISKVNFKEGDYVKKGDLLVVLDDRTLRAQLREQEANQTKERTQAENLRLQYERNVELTEKGFESRANLDDSKAAYESQMASYNSIGAQAENLKVLLGYSQIRAPISGRTGALNIKEGNTVKANDATPLVTINQIKPIAVLFSIPQNYLGKVKESVGSGALTVEASSDSLKEPVTGEVKYINNEIDQTTGSFIVKAIFKNEDESLWPGMFVNLKLFLGNEENALAIPEPSLQQSQSGYFVFVVRDGKAVKQEVQYSRVSEGWAVISSGLNEGDEVITDGLLSITDGSAVEVHNKVEEAAPVEENNNTEK